jgi:hypothetical protein
MVLLFVARLKERFANMATPQELLDEQKQKDLDTKVDKAYKDVKVRDTKENLDAVEALKSIPKKIVNTVKKAFKSGGVVKDLKKAGFYDAKKDKAKRLSIINKVTTKPQRIEMVDKLFTAKKMALGGSTASKRADGCATKGKTKGRII